MSLARRSLTEVQAVGVVLSGELAVALVRRLPVMAVRAAARRLREEAEVAVFEECASTSFPSQRTRQYAQGS